MKEMAEITRRIAFQVATVAVLAMFLMLLPLESQAQETGKIYGKAAVIMKSGDVKPVAKGDFVVLPFSLHDLEVKARKEAEEQLGPPPPIRRGSTNELMESFRKQDEYRPKVAKYASKIIREELDKAQEQGKYIRFRTEFDGSYEVVVPPGDWYICNEFVFISVGNARIDWSVPITVKAGQHLKLDLENSNASKIFD